MGSVDDFLGSRLGLRSSRVSSNSTFGDHAENEQLLSSSYLDNGNLNETKKSQGRSWKAKREDYDEEDNVFGTRTKENTNAITLQRRIATQPLGMLTLISPRLFPDEPWGEGIFWDERREV